MKKCKVLGVAFLLAMILRVVSSYATGILWNWHIFTWFYIWGNYSNAAIWAENWGWYIELTPAINGAGMIVGLNTALSMFGSTVMCYAIIGPLLVKYGAASGVKIMGPNATGHWKDLTTYFSMNLKDPINNPSPRYWLLWPYVFSPLCLSSGRCVANNISSQRCTSHGHGRHCGVSFSIQDTDSRLQNPRHGCEECIHCDQEAFRT